MARPPKTGFRYFPLYHELFSSDKIRLAEDIIDPTGDDIHARMLVDKFLIRVFSEIFKIGYYLPWNDNAKHKLCSEIGNGLTVIKLDKYINAFLSSNLLNKHLFDSHNILTSKGIQEEWLNISIVYFRRKKAYINTEYNLIVSEETRVNSEETSRSLGKNKSKLGKTHKIQPEQPKKDSNIVVNSEETIVNSETTPVSSEHKVVVSEAPIIIISTIDTTIDNKGNTEGIIKNIINNDDKGNSEETRVNSEEIGDLLGINGSNGHIEGGKEGKNGVFSDKKVVNSEETQINSENKGISEVLVMIDSFHNIDHLFEVYFSSNELSRTREQVAMANHMDADTLKDWGAAFNRFLIMEGIVTKKKSDWPKHFKNWLAKQNRDLNPQNLFNEKSTENGKSTKSTSGPIKGHQPVSTKSVLDKIDILLSKDGHRG